MGAGTFEGGHVLAHGDVPTAGEYACPTHVVAE